MCNELLERLNKRRSIVDSGCVTFENTPHTSNACSKSLFAATKAADQIATSSRTLVERDEPRTCSKSKDFKEVIRSRRLLVDEKGEKFESAQVSHERADVERLLVESEADGTQVADAFELPWERSVPRAKGQDFKTALNRRRAEVDEKGQTWRGNSVSAADLEGALALFEAAKKLHQQGSCLADAEAGYEASRAKIERDDQEDRPYWEADLLHLLGAVMVQRLCPTDVGESDEENDEAIMVPSPGAKSLHKNTSDVPETPLKSSDGTKSDPYDAERQKRGEKALLHLERAASLSPATGRFWQTLGIARFKVAQQGDMKMLEAAYDSLTKASQLARNADQSASSLEKAHQVLRVIEKGQPPARRIKVVEQVLQLRPDDTRFHFTLGVCCYQLGQHERAVNAFDTHIRICESDDTVSPDAHNVSKAKDWIKMLRESLKSSC